MPISYGDGKHISPFNEPTIEHILQLGRAQNDDMSLSNAINEFGFLLTFGENQDTWVSHPNNPTTTSRKPAFFATAGVAATTNLLGLRNTGSLACQSFSPSHKPLVTSNANSDSPQTNVWTLYGKYVMLSQPYLNSYSQSTRQHEWNILLWGAAVDAAVKNNPVTLRTITPASG
ncbi:hypothetical protein N7475_008008 [Penicillium sp. IBT 31633x]|nr:hypothetical protein N7475_008008 [Penicillium sp. IBT 31633x]